MRRRRPPTGADLRRAERRPAGRAPRRRRRGRHRAGHGLFREGEHADHWWVVVDGALDLVRHIGREDVAHTAAAAGRNEPPAAATASQPGTPAATEPARACPTPARKNPRFEIVAAASAADLLPIVAARTPHVAVISADLDSGTKRGSNVARNLNSRHPSVHIVMLLEIGTRESVVAAFRCGAVGVFCRTDPLPELPTCIEHVGRGEIWASRNHCAVSARGSQTHSILRGHRGRQDRWAYASGTSGG